MSTTMKAIRVHHFGGPEVLRYETVPVPELRSGEVLVRAHAIGVNPPDWYLRDGYAHQELPPDVRPVITLPAIPGSDVSGVVAAVASDVADIAVGDEVFGMIRFPSFGDSAAYAEYVAAPVTDLARKPAGIDHLHAAAAPMSGLTAWQFLLELGHETPNPLQPQEHRPVPLAGATVMVNGAAGGVGHIAVQLAKSRGAHVIAVASGRHADFLRELGADEVIDYTERTPEDTVAGLDLVLDTVGGPATGRFLRTLRPGGALFPVFPGFSDAAEAAARGATVSMTQVRSNGAQLAELARVLDDGTVRIALDSTFGLDEARAAHERAERGHLRGKIALSVLG
ncbi:MAG: NADP-dependent oxidoreductase [Mycolicibacterium rufum]|uniref:Putative NADP-dependent oxidoreductase YfmJ n=1 Tax=Mycolicibacterium chlorophenolicum TaxID=37916 RepID=A0A0J6YC36_9MYCO|nr:NADP-dependent oxidoreductase [Mycolicibacterium chlorophenolicum]KMO70366.1 putative NADP-dependent oxidoreductase YfmJ [Mycolicibacterium chlorophenolicum]MBI5336077.1 NADP-dependent oxidoreductase [Mycolicibacterium rufum]